jgi:hypothetical protein
MHLYNSNRIIILVMTFMAIFNSSFGQYSITGDATQTITFTSFTGTGFTPGASTTGSLDSDIWAVDLSNDGTMDSDFGDTNTGDPYAGGEEASQWNLGVWPPGQVRAFTYDVARLGVRNGAAGFESDIALVMRIQNNTGGDITALEIIYDAQSRVTNGTAAEIEFYYSSDNVTYTEITALGTSFTPTTHWGEAATQLSSSITGITIANGDFYYLKWVWKEHDDTAAGIGIAQIDLTATVAAGAGEGTITAGSTNFGNLVSTSVSDPGEDVFDFTITDDASTGADAFPIQFTDVIFTEGASDAIDDWSDVIAGARLEDTGGNAINASSIGPNSITFSGIGITSTDVGYVPDDGSETYTLSVWLNTTISEEIDGDLLHIELSGANFSFSGATSTITVTESATSDISYNDIEVTGTNWGFDNPPSVVGLDEDFSLTVASVDVYGNIDLDDNSSSFILSRGATGSNNLTEGGSSKTALSAKTLTLGKYAYSDLQYDASESFDIDVDDSGGSFLTSTTSSSILAAVSYQSIASGNWTADFATIWEYWNGSAWTTATTFPTSADGNIFIRSGTDISIDANITADQIVVESGGEISLNQNNLVLTIADGPDEDLIIENGGTVSLDNYNALPTFTGTVQVQGGATFSCSVGRLNEVATSTQIDWQTDAIFYYTNGNAFSYNTTYFPSVADGIYPIFEVDGFTAATNNLWVLNGILKVTSGTLNLSGTNITIRDGVFADGALTITNPANFTGSTLHFGGTGSIDLNGETYSWSGKTIEMLADQEIFNGFISMDGTSTINGYAFSLNDGTNDNLDLTILNGSTINSNATGGLATTLALDGTLNIGTALDYNFEGTGTQTLGFGTIGVTNANRVTVNNSAGVILDSDLTIDDRLTLTSGVFATSSSNEVITISSTGIIVGASSTNYFDGPLEIQQFSSGYTFHVGDGSNYRPVLITPATTSNVTVEAIYSTPPNNTSVGSGLSTSMAGLYWEIQRGSGTGDVSAQLYYKETTSVSTPDNDLIADGTNLRLIQYDGSSWQDNGLDANNSDLANLSSITGTVTTFAGSNDFFTIGSETGTTVLPVEFISFEALKSDDGVLLKWATATEIDNDQFEVQHSIDGEDWSKIGEVKGAGTTNEPMFYEFKHNSPMFANNYYRLKQIDLDGDFEFSELAWIYIEESGAESIVIMGNPINNKTLRFSYSGITNPLVQLIGLNGHTVLEKPVNKFELIELDLSEFPNGVYILRVNNKTIDRFVIK